MNDSAIKQEQYELFMVDDSVELYDDDEAEAEGNLASRQPQDEQFDEVMKQQVEQQQANPAIPLRLRNASNRAIMTFCRKMNQPIPKELYSKLSQVSQAKLYFRNPCWYKDFDIRGRYRKLICNICGHSYSATNKQRHLKSTVCRMAQE